MTNDNPAQDIPGKEEPKNIKFQDFVNITKWAVKTVYEMSPKYVTANFIARILVDLQGIANAYIISKILDQIISLLQGNVTSLSGIYPYMGLLVGLSLVSSILHYFNLFTERSINALFRQKMEELIFMKLKNLGIQTLENPVITNKITRADSESYALGNYYFRFVTTFSIFVSLIISAFLIARVAPEIIPLIFILSVPSVLVDRHFIKKTWKFGFDNTEGRRKAFTSSSRLTDPASLKEIFINGAHTFLADKFRNFVTWYYEVETEMRSRWYLGTRAFGFLTDVGVYIGYLIVFAKLLARRITVGDALFNVRLIDRISGDIGDLIGRLSVLYEYAVRTEVIYDLLNLNPTFPDGEVIVPKLKKGPEVEIKGVNFKYPNSEINVLENFNLHINSGEKVAIVGHNGAGKTSLVKLLCRLYPVDRGEILINGDNINNGQDSSYGGCVGQFYFIHPFK